MSLTLPRALDESIGFNLDRAAVLVRRELIRALAPDGLLPEQWQVLVVLADQGSLSQQALADALLTDKHGMSRMLARMERGGWIERVPSPEDSRSRLVRPTKKASDRLEPMMAAVRARFRKRLAPLRAEDRDMLLGLLRHLRTMLRDTL